MSSGERAGLGRPFREDGEAAGRGADVSAPPRPFSCFSQRWDGEGAKAGALREEGEELLRRTCEGDSDWLRQGIFSRLTTGRDTLKRGNKDFKKKKEARKCC